MKIFKKKNKDFIKQTYTIYPNDPDNPEGIRAYFQKIIDAMPNNVYWLDKNCITMGCNKNTLNLVGLKKLEDFVGITYEEMGKIANWTENQAMSFKKDDMEVISTGKTKLNVEEPPLYDKNGNPVYYLSSRVPIFDTNNQVIGVIGISVDITELKKAKETAESANRVMTQFIQNMQHDIRTPASGISGMLDILAQKIKDPKIKHMVTLIGESAKELLNLCNEVIDFDKTEKDAEPIVFSDTILREFVKSAIKLNKAAAYRKMVDLQIHINENVPLKLAVDQYRLKRILINLIGNAIKFTPEGGSVYLNVSLIKKTKKKAFLQFEVKDTGIGFDEKDKNRIFEKFVRLNPSNEGIYKGTGLGLSMVKRFVTELGGNIDVTSQPGNGATFIIKMAFDILDVQSEKPNLESSAKTHLHQHIRLLFIEDDPIAMMVGLNNLENLGYIADIADSVKSAKEHLLHQQYQFVLSDIGLPDGKGTDLVAWVKSHPLHLNANTPFIALTAHSSPEVIELALKKGFLAVLNKPFSTEEVRKLVEKHATTLPVSKKNIELPSLEKATDELTIPLNNIIDLGTTLHVQCGGNQDLLKNALHSLWESLPNDLLELEKLCETNDIEKTRKILHRLAGTFRYIVVPRLQQTRMALHEAVKQTDTLSKLYPLYKDFFKEMDNYMLAYEKLKRAGKI